MQMEGLIKMLIKELRSVVGHCATWTIPVHSHVMNSSVAFEALFIHLLSRERAT